MTRCVFFSALLLAASCGQPEPAPGVPNLLLVLLDDVGQDAIAAYGVSPGPPRTPTLDRLADEGVRFTRAYAYPSCKSSRAALLTGRYVRDGIVGGDLRLREGPRTFAEVAWDAGYETAIFGKWHLSGSRNGATRAPLRRGFDHFVGRMGNFSDTARDWGRPYDYFRWELIRNGRRSLETDWAPSVVIDEAADWIADREGPWLAYVALSAAHGPMHLPPADLHTADVSEDSPEHDLFRAVVEAADTEVARLLAGIRPEVLENTVVIVTGDNGTDHRRDDPGFDVLGGKTTIYEGGIRVPLIVAGPPVGAAGSVHDGLVHFVDILPTIAELVEGDAGSVNGQSFVSAVEDPQQPGARSALFAELRLDVVDRRVMLSRTLKLVDEAHRGEEWIARIGENPADEVVVEASDLEATEQAELSRLRDALGARLEEF